MGSTWYDVPEEVREAYDQGLWLIPRTYNPSAQRWHPPFKWRGRKDERPTKLDIIRWNREYPAALWAIVTGRVVLVAEFDGAEGKATMQRLNLRPHTLSPSGGGHVRIEVPRGSLVRGGARIDPARFPGMDLQAYGQTATFYGTRPPDGSYRIAPTAPPAPYEFDEIPRDLHALIRRQQLSRTQLAAPPVPPDFKAWRPRQIILGEALARLELYPARNETGFWLACQLRDEQYTLAEIEEAMRQYVTLISKMGSHPYTWEEAHYSIISALHQPARLPRNLRVSADVELVSDVRAEKLTWLWTYRIPMRKVTILEGDPDLGKSTLTLDIAAHVSRGLTLPADDQRQPAGSVLIICGEDDVADTIKPRLKAAGAIDKRIGYIPLAKDDQGHVIPLSIPEDLARIRRSLDVLRTKTGKEPRLLIIDPITAYLSETINSNNDPQVRRAMLPLKQLAEETGVAVLLVRHLNKDGGLRAMYRGGGSIAFSASARSVLVAERHPEQDGMYVLARVKMNLGPQIRPITYRLEPVAELDVPRIEWGDEIDITVDALLHSEDARRDAPQRREASRWLRDLLADGPMNAQDIKKQADQAGLSWWTVKKAKREAGVMSEKDVDPNSYEIHGWRWRLATGDGKIRFEL